MLLLVKQMGVILCAQVFGIMRDCTFSSWVMRLLIFVAMTGHCYLLVLLSTFN